VGTTITYQGFLKNASGPVNGTCNFFMDVFSAPAGGIAVEPNNVNNVLVTNGLFTANIPLDSTTINGDARFLRIAAQCPAGSGLYTFLSPRQELRAAPYALSLRPGAQISGNVTGGALQVTNGLTNTVGDGIQGTSNSSSASGVAGFNTSNGGYGVYGSVSYGDAIHGDAAGGIGVYGNGFIGVYGNNNNGNGWGMSTNGVVNQSRSRGGWVKALVRMENGNITGCFNSQVISPAVSEVPPCGFTLSGSGGNYVVGFGYTVNDRFVSVTPLWASGGAVIPVVSFPMANQVRVQTYSGGTTLVDSAFFLIIY